MAGSCSRYDELWRARVGQNIVAQLPGRQLGEHLMDGASARTPVASVQRDPSASPQDDKPQDDKPQDDKPQDDKPQDDEISG